MSCPFEQTFQDGFFSPVSYFCVVVEALLQPQCRRDLLLIFARFSENSTDTSSFVGFDVIYIHRSLCLVLAVLLLSLTPATVSPIFAVNHSSFSYVYCENSTGFDV